MLYGKDDNMFTCKIKIGAEWRLPKKKLGKDTYDGNGKKMNDINAIKEILKSLKGQYENISQKEDGEYIIIEAS